MEEPKVYIPSQPFRWDIIDRKLKPIYDLSQAEQYGDLVDVLGSISSEVVTLEIKNKIWSSLKSYTERDYILCIGDPSVLSLASVVAALRNGGRVTLLKYNRKTKTYAPVHINYIKEMCDVD